jgi:transcriptional regulator GlxA family with amidase domain
MAKFDFTVLLLPAAFSSSVALTLDLLQAAAALAPRLRMPTPTWRVVAPGGGALTLSNGMLCTAQALPTRAGADASTWIVPGLGIDQPADLVARMQSAAAQQACAALQQHVARGGAVAASCSAVFLLQAAGLLQGRTVTTTWWLAAELRRMEPSCTVNVDRMVCADGSISTAGAALAHGDLMLHLLRTRFGAALADAVGKVLLINGRHAQAPFVVPSMLSNGSDLIRHLTKRIESSLPNIISVAALAQAHAMSQRTLTRHVHAATGQSAMALIQSVRLNRARALIESSRLSIDQVAAQVGYGDATALRRLMRKTAGVTPSQFRAARVMG